MALSQVKVRLRTFTVASAPRPATENDTIYIVRDAVRIAQAIYESCQLDFDREHGLVLGLNARNQVLGYKVIGSGSTSTLRIDPKDLLLAVLRLNAEGWIFVHNHPSGSSKPSREDGLCTKRLHEAGTLLGLPLLDAIILTNAPDGRSWGTAFSYVEEGRKPFGVED